MGDHNSGGGGSVYWRIDLDEVPRVTTRPQDAGGGWTETGRDPDPAKIEEEWFTVSIKVPEEFSRGSSAEEAITKYLTALRDGKSRWALKGHPREKNRVYFNVRLEKDDEERPSQIRTSWGRSRNVVR